MGLPLAGARWAGFPGVYAKRFDLTSQPGRLLGLVKKGTPFGRYELLRKIAAGGMAEIFLARQWGQGGFFRDVVIKALFRHMAENEKTLKMFQYEARLVAELCHPNIAQVYELGHAEGTWFIAMEYVDGHTVADTWRTGARAGHVMSLPVAVGVVMQACEALHHAHERRDRGGEHLRIVHRDVTPQNLILTRDGVTKVMDFGVAQTAARMDTEAGVLKGTFSYMAPEQVRARPLDKRADVFALGVILYELTTGTRLFRGSDVQVMTAIVERDAPLPSTHHPDFPPELEAIIMTALSRDRQKRFPSAAHLVAALEKFALRNRLLVGPRTVARYVQRIYPYEREKELDVALVDTGRHDRVVPKVPEFDDESISADLDLLHPDQPEGRATRRDLPQVPEAQLGDQEDLATEPGAQGGHLRDGVVLLDTPKRQEAAGRRAPREGYVDDLERRLEDDFD